MNILLFIALFIGCNTYAADNASPENQNKQDWVSAKQIAQQHGFDTVQALQLIATTPPDDISTLQIPKKSLFKAWRLLYAEHPQDFTQEQWELLKSADVLQRIEKYRPDSLHTWHLVEKNNIIQAKKNSADSKRPNKCDRDITCAVSNSPWLTFHIIQQLPSYEDTSSFEKPKLKKCSVIQSVLFKTTNKKPSLKLTADEYQALIPQDVSWTVGENNAKTITLTYKKPGNSESYKATWKSTRNAKADDFNTYLLKEVAYRVKTANFDAIIPFMLDKNALKASLTDKSKDRFWKLGLKTSHSKIKAVDAQQYIFKKS